METSAKTVAELEAENERLRRELIEAQESLEARRRGTAAVDSVCDPAEELLSSETFAALVLDQTQDAIVVCDRSGRVVRANRAADQLCGRDPLSQPFGVAFPLRGALGPGRPCEAISEAELSLFPATSTATPRDVEACLVRQDGLRLDLLVSVAPMRDRERRLLGAVVTMTDITERKQAEESLRQAKEEWEKTFDAIPDFVAVIDDQCRIVRANRAMADRLGLTQAECVGINCYQLVHGTTEPPAYCPHMATCRNSRQHMVEMFEPRLGGDMLVSTSPWFDEQGRAIGTVHVARDITERKRRDAQIATLTRVYAVLSQVNEAIVRIHDAPTLFAEVCRIVAETGRLPLAWVGQRRGNKVIPVAFTGPSAGMIREITVEVEGELGAGPTGTCIRENHAVINDDFALNPAMAPWCAPALRYGVQTSAAFPLRRQGEAVGSLTIYASDSKAFDAEQIGLFESLSANISYALDVIDHEDRRVRAEEALRRSADELARSNQDLEQFASVASHDLQEPLRTVNGFAQLLRKHYANQLDAEGNNFIEFIVEGTTRMQTLIRDLLAYSRVGTRHREPVSIDANASLRQVLADLQDSIRHTGAEVTYGELPVVRADPSQLAQLFQNLIGNAMKFRGESSPRIHIEANQEGDYWRFSVRDNGIGIEPRFREQIFEVFRRLHTRDRYEGTGIGLAICKKIVDRHGGRIWVESELGHGAAFHFTLPK
ncbi:MAG: PAS domain-containing protein [Planctomycetaceae bacterium]|nr:PAS domain-containing protein [Planctomycetaceae bacterium]